jgi:hypothetical protein
MNRAVKLRKRTPVRNYEEEETLSDCLMWSIVGSLFFIFFLILLYT